MAFLSLVFVFFCGLAVPVYGQQAHIRVAYDEATHHWYFRSGDKKFLSKGVVGIRFQGEVSPRDDQSYGQVLTAQGLTPATFAQQAAARLRAWGFNTVGPWSDPILYQDTDLYYTLIIAGTDKGIQPGSPLKRFPDVFDPAFALQVEARVQEVAAPHRQSTRLIGYFTDNELHWGLDLLDRFLKLPPGRPGREAAAAFLRTSGGATQSQSRVLGDDQRQAFLRLAAQKYFQTYQQAMRNHAPHQLNLGCRFAAFKHYHPIVAEVAGQYVDVVSINHYPRNLAAIINDLRALHRLSGKPVLLSEFSVRARDSKLPNTKGGGVLVDTQRQRGEWYQQFVGELVLEPYIVGYHWFRWLDEPKQGRFDGEDSNVGLVDAQNNPYKDFIELIKGQ